MSYESDTRGVLTSGTTISQYALQILVIALHMNYEHAQQKSVLCDYTQYNLCAQCCACLNMLQQAAVDAYCIKRTKRSVKHTHLGDLEAFLQPAACYKS